MRKLYYEKEERSPIVSFKPTKSKNVGIVFFYHNVIAIRCIFTVQSSLQLVALNNNDGIIN